MVITLVKAGSNTDELVATPELLDDDGTDPVPIGLTIAELVLVTGGPGGPGTGTVGLGL